MNILKKILTLKHREVEERKELYPLKLLEKSIYYETQGVSLKKYLLRPDLHGIIAEIKRRSPSKGMLNEYVRIEQVSIGFMQAGASALSVLTDSEFFGGSNEDLIIARKFNYCPILRKDFIIDEYQVIETKSIGADALLLIAVALPPKKVDKLATLAKSIGLEVLLEVSDEKELQTCISKSVDVVGVNNRELHNFTTDLKRSFKLAGLVPKEFLKISESGINSPGSVRKLRNLGYNGFLIGEIFMKSGNPQIACSDFIRQLCANKK